MADEKTPEEQEVTDDVKMEEEKADEEEGEKKEATFESDELEKIPDAETKEREEIEKFLEDVKKERDQEDVVAEEEVPPSPPEIREKIPETEEELPAWAEKIGEAEPAESPPQEISPSEETPPEEEVKEEHLREKLDLEERGEADEIEEEKLQTKEVDVPGGEEETALRFEAIEEERMKEEITPSRSLAARLKSRVFDILFITACWIVSILIAARLLEVSFLKLISDSMLPVIGYYVILLIIYFPLFLLFLGKTLGDHIFSEER